ncbi:MAG: hypothetical protein WC979_07910 [Candidatus Pacearchaeota archaeon]|jgi:hypothetical protein
MQNSGMLDVGGILNKVSVLIGNVASIVISPVLSSTSSGSIVTSNGTVLSENTLAIERVVQNLSANPIYINFGAGASNTKFSIVLQGGSAQDDGKGGILSEQQYTGIISASGSSPRLSVFEVTL